MCISSMVWISSSFLGVPTAKSMAILPQYHGSFIINGDAELDAFCAGNETDGTETNPHVIENFEILYDGAQNGIMIINTSRYLNIQNVNVSEFKVALNSKGLYLLNAEHITILDCHFVNNSYGIFLENTNKTHTNRTASILSKKSGISLFNSHNNTFYDVVTLSNNESGIELYYSDYNIIQYNLFLENNLYGLLLQSSYYNEVFDNIFLYNKIDCIYNPTDPENTNNIYDNDCRSGKIPGIPVWIIGVVLVITISSIVTITIRSINKKRPNS